MGIYRLNNLLRKNAPIIYEKIHLSQFQYKKVAIDTSLFLFKFKAIYSTNWLQAFIKMIACLRSNEVHCVFIFDNGAPPEKDIEKDKRIKQRQINEERTTQLEESLDRYYQTGEFSQNLIDLYEKNKYTEVGPKRLLNVKQTDIELDVLKKSISKMRSNIIKIYKEDFEALRELFTTMNVPFYNAILEGEASCSDLCKRNLVDAVLSEDTDVLCYGSPIFLTKINIYDSTCIQIRYENVLEQLGVTDSQFLDLCILCGCDYNKNIPLIGPQKALKYIKCYNTIENILLQLKLNGDCLKFARTRELFRDYERLNINKIPFCGKPNFELLEKFSNKFNLNINIDSIKNCFICTDFTIIEDNITEDNITEDNITPYIEINIEVTPNN